MSALVAILLVSIASLVMLRLALPARMRHRVGRGEFAMAILLPTAAMLSPAYAVFAVIVMVIIALAPAFAGVTKAPPAFAGVTKAPPAVAGASVARVGAMDRRMQLLVFALPLLPVLQYTAMISSYTIAQIHSTSLLCAGALAALMFGGARMPTVRLAGWDVCFLAMMLMQLFMDARDQDLMFALRMVVQLIITLGLPYFVISRAVAMARDPSQLLVSLLLAACLLAALALVESYRHWLLYADMINRVGADPETFSGYTKLRGGMLRGRATYPESTGLSLFLGLALTMLFAMRRSIGSAGLVWMMAAFLAAGLVMSFARIGYLTSAVGFAMVLLFERRFGVVLAVAVAAPLIVGLVTLLGDAVPFIGASIGSSSDSIGSVSYRSELLAAGQRLIAENPIFGLGTRDLMDRLILLKQGEGIVDLVNQPLAILLRAGIVGGVAYYAMTVLVMVRLWGYRGRDVAVRATAAACFAGLAAMLAGLLTTSYGRNETFYVIVLAAGAGTLARRASPAGRPAAAALASAVPATT